MSASPPTARSLVLAALILIGVTMMAPADHPAIYYTTRAEVFQAGLDGGNPVAIDDTGNTAAGISYDPIGQKLYWADLAAHKVRRSNLDGSSVENLSIFATSAYAVALDLKNAKLCSSDEDVLRLALDRANGHIYWTEDNQLRRSGLDGTSPVTIHSDPDTNANYLGIDLDVVNGKIYWTDNSNDTVNRCSMDGSGPEVLITVTQPSPNPHDVVLVHPLQVIALSRPSSDSLSISVPTDPNLTYRLSYSLGTPAWMNSTPLTGDGSVRSLLRTIPSGSTHEIYRVECAR